MRRIPKRASPYVGPVVLYRQEVEALAEMLRRDNSQIEFHCSNMVFDTIDEMREHVGPKVNQLKIRSTSHPIAYLEIDEGTFLIVTPDAEEGLLLRIREFLLEYQRWAVTQPLTQLAIGLSVGSVLAIGVTLAAPSGFPWIWRTSAVAFVAIAVVSARWWVPFGSIVYLKRRHEHQNFWQRHEENWVRGLIGLITLLLGAALGYWLGKN